MKMSDLSTSAEPSGVTETMPVLFLGHGSPMNAIEENEFVAGFRRVGKDIPKPIAILCVSAHWETAGTFVTAMEKPKTIHDFGGFPKELFSVQYPASGSPALAEETKRIVTTTDVGLDHEWGLDHGCWSVMKHLYPNADVPVIQMSLDYRQTPHDHYELAKELAVFRKRGVLIVGSGNMVHNLSMAAWDRLDATEYGYDWALEAGEKMKKYVLEGDHQSLIHYQTLGRAMQLAVPTPEHFLPLLYALALKMPGEQIRVFNDKTVAGSLAMTSFEIGRV